MGYAKSTRGEQAMPAALALTSVSKSEPTVTFGDLDLNANPVGGDVSWILPVGDASTKAYETCFATEATSSGGALAGSMTIGTKV